MIWSRTHGHFYPSHAFLGGEHSYLLIQWCRGDTVNGPGIQLIIRGARIGQIGFRPHRPKPCPRDISCMTIWATAKADPASGRRNGEPGARGAGDQTTHR